MFEFAVERSVSVQSVPGRHGTARDQENFGSRTSGQVFGVRFLIARA